MRSLILITLVPVIMFLEFTATEALISEIVSAAESGIGYIFQSLESIFGEILDLPKNSNSSIQYHLYTPDHPNDTCYLESNEKALKRCPFDPRLPMKFLISGFLEDLDYGNDFSVMKNRFLEFYQYNVIIVDWTKYNKPPYILASFNTVLVGNQVANMIKYLEKNVGVDPKNVHIIGHSLGAHISGVAGKNTPNLWRITGLDPAGPYFGPFTLLHRLTYTDATFVDVIHTANKIIGFGVSVSVGDMDFYPNGGSDQPQCLEDAQNQTAPGATFVNVKVCNHGASVDYFTESIDSTTCHFWAVQCDSYSDFQSGLCPPNSSTIAEMGLHSRMISGLPPKTGFALRTSTTPPYCLQDGYEPE